MDGVLVHNMEFHKQAWQAFCQKYAPEVQQDEFHTHFGKVNRDLLAWVFNRPLSESEIKDYAEEKEEIYREIYTPHIKLAENLRDVLTELKIRNFTLAVGTSAPPENLHFVLEKTRTARFFSALVDESMVKNGKPKPDIYLKAAHFLGVSPKQCIVVEDSPAGIQAARNAGMKVVGIASTHTPEKLNGTDLTIKNFSEWKTQKIDQLLNV